MIERGLEIGEHPVGGGAAAAHRLGVLVQRVLRTVVKP
jgi:hypothetical protein